MDGRLTPELITALDGAGISLPPGGNPLETLLAASRARGLCFRIEQMPCFRDLPVHGGPRFRAVVWADHAGLETPQPSDRAAVRGRGDNGAVAMAHALLASLARSPRTKAGVAVEA